MRAVKILSIVFAGFVTAFILLLLAVWLFVDPNDFKPKIAERVRLATGRELKLDGDLKLSVFPWLALESGSASLSNPPGFDATPLLAVQSAKLRVRLWPLLHHQLHVGKIEVVGLDLHLQKNAQGRGNWQFDEPDAQTPPTGESSSQTLQSLEGVRIKNGRVTFEPWVVSNIDVDIGKFASHQTIPATFRFDALRTTDQVGVSASGALKSQLDFEAKRYALTDASFGGELKLGGAQKPLTWKLELPALEYASQLQTLALRAFNASVAGAKISGALNGEKISDAPSFRGTLRVEPVSVRELLATLGKPVPRTRDGKVLSSFSMTSSLTYENKTLSLANLAARLDDSSLSGSLSFATEPTAIQFALSIDQLNADRYLAPDQPPAEKSQPMDLSADVLKPLRVKGSLAIGHAVVSGVALDKIQLSVDSVDGLLKLAPVKAVLYGGQLAAALTYDVRGAAPSMQLEQSMKGIQMTDVLKAVMKSNRVSGRGNCTARLSGQGRTSEQMLKSLKGRVDADLADGAIEGVDVWYEIKRAESLIRAQSLPSGASTGRTRFDTFRTSVDLDRGTANTRDLTIASQQLRVTGKGTTDLVSKVIDFDLLATLLKGGGAAAQSNAGRALAGASLIDVPLQVTGKLDAPKIRVDLQSLAKTRIKQELEQHQDELQKKLQDKLKSKLSHWLSKP